MLIASTLLVGVGCTGASDFREPEQYTIDTASAGLRVQRCELSGQLDGRTDFGSVQCGSIGLGHGHTYVDMSAAVERGRVMAILSSDVDFSKPGTASTGQDAPSPTDFAPESVTGCSFDDAGNMENEQIEEEEIDVKTIEGEEEGTVEILFSAKYPGADHLDARVVLERIAQ